jgi:hypothetical protein
MPNLLPCQAIRVVTVLLGVLGAVLPAHADQQPRVRHPNLLLNAREIEQVKAKIKQHAWAARLFDVVRKTADDPRHSNRNPREAALVYALTGDRRYAQIARRALLGNARASLMQYDRLDLKANPDFGSWGPWATYAWAYDLTHDTFSAEERRLIERLLRTAARTIIEGLKLRGTTPNLVFEKHWKVGLIGYCLGDRELIDWGLNDPGKHGPHCGGFYPVLDTMIKDGRFWGEAPIYALHYDLHGMLALAEAALHYDGTDLYRHVSKKSGGSIKRLIDGYLRLAFPLEKTGVGGGSLRLATFGDGSTSFSPLGELYDTFLINPVGGTLGEVTMNGELEIAYKRYKDPGYAWLLGLNPRRDAYIGSPGQGGIRPVWGYAALTHGEPLPEKPTPPPAPSAVYPSQGLAMLRSDETGRYWTAGGTAAVLRLGAAVGHGHKDYFHLILHGKGRLLYPDLNIIQYEPIYLHWTHEGIAHNTLLVDHQSPRPGSFTTRQDFGPAAQFFAVAGSAFEGVTQTRVLLMTPDYVADVFRAADKRGQPRTFDWVLHGLGRLYLGNPAAYRPTHSLVPFYWWVDNERGRKADAAWQADWIQRSGGVTRQVQRFGKEWFEQTIGCRLTMLGVQGTEVFAGDGPITDGPPFHRIEGNPEGSSPLVVARRRARATTFAAVHEPYANRPALRQIRRLQETDAAVALGVEGPSFSDRVLVAFDANREHTLRSAGGEAFTFRGHGYLRLAAGHLTVRGNVRAFRVHAPRSDQATLTVNGKARTVGREGAFLVFGDLKNTQDGQAGPASADDAVERRAAVHYAFSPEEVHLRAGGAKETTLHLRCVGQGKAQGRLRLVAPRGIRVEPAVVEVADLSEGEEKSVRLRVKANADAANVLHHVRIEPAEKTPAAPGSLPVSVGVVLTTDTRIPLAAQTVVRAPGYTMKVAQRSGVSYYLLDADGHRRHGRLHNTNFCFGIPALESAGKWVLQYGRPCRFAWEQKNGLTVVTGSGTDQVRLRYAFHEERVALTLIPPTSPRRTFTMWLGNFDALGPPRHNGTQDRPHEPVRADWCFFPHPVHRQGLLLLLPAKTPLAARGSAVHFPLRAGQQVVLRFAGAGELPALVGGKEDR